MSDSTPPPEFFAELAEAFRRYRPQGSLEWNFLAAFGALESAGAEAAVWSGESSEAAPAGEPGLGDRLRLLAHDRVSARLFPVPRERPSADDALARRVLAQELEATLGAFRYLLARVERLERAASRRREPVEGVPWLLDPPTIGGWAEPLARWIADQAPEGQVVVGDCGEGQLVAELARHGRPVTGTEPRGTAAWRAAGRGVQIKVASVGDHLSRLAPGTLGAVVLCDVVDRVAIEDLVALLRSALEAARPDAPVVVLGRDPANWPGGGADLLPGRPLSPETWQVLLERLGCRAVERLEDTASDPGQRVHCIRGRRAP